VAGPCRRVDSSRGIRWDGEDDLYPLSSYQNVLQNYAQDISKANAHSPTQAKMIEQSLGAPIEILRLPIPKFQHNNPRSGQCPGHPQNDVAYILHFLSLVQLVVPQLRKEQYRHQHMKFTPALAALTPPSLFAPSSTLFKNSDYGSSAKKGISIPPSSPTSHFDPNNSVSIKVDISKVMSHTCTALTISNQLPTACRRPRMTYSMWPRN